MPFGEAHHNVKLSKSLVRAIRQEYADGPLTQRLLAEKYSVTQPTISKIITGKRRTKEFKINA
jgi:predicted XRE-type DNA-binding protein